MTDDSAPRSAVAGLSACGQPDTQAGDALAGRAQREPLERLVGDQLADGRQAVRRCGRQGLRRRFIPRRSGAGTAGPADTAASGERGWHAGRPSRCYTSTPNRSHSPSSSWLLSASSPAARRIAAAASSCPALISRSASAAATASSKVSLRSMMTLMRAITE